MEIGEPGELLKVEGGKFRGLWEGGREVGNVANGLDR